MNTSDRETILVGVDGSQSSIEALVWAEALGTKLGTRVTAAMAWKYPARFALPGGGKPDRPADEMDEQTVEQLEQIVNRAGLGNVECRSLRGPAPDALQRASTRPDVRMLVLGTRGLGTITGLMLGSVSRSLLFSTARPLILVPQHRTRARLDRIVAGLDGSPISNSVAAWTAKLCKDLGAAVTILRCVDPGAEHSPELLDEIMTRSQLDFESECCGVFRGLGVDHEPVIRRGDPRRCLIETAQGEEAGLIVVGQRGAGQFDGLGGTASYLVRHSSLPLAIIPPPPAQ
jgi:nucleotide-binding universal stress UspA family protein